MIEKIQTNLKQLPQAATVTETNPQVKDNKESSDFIKRHALEIGLGTAALAAAVIGGIYYIKRGKGEDAAVSIVKKGEEIIPVKGKKTSGTPDPHKIPEAKETAPLDEIKPEETPKPLKTSDTSDTIEQPKADPEPEPLKANGEITPEKASVQTVKETKEQPSKTEIPTPVETVTETVQTKPVVNNEAKNTEPKLSEIKNNEVKNTEQPNSDSKKAEKEISVKYNEPPKPAPAKNVTPKAEPAQKASVNTISAQTVKTTQEKNIDNTYKQVQQNNTETVVITENKSGKADISSNQAFSPAVIKEAQELFNSSPGNFNKILTETQNEVKNYDFVKNPLSLNYKSYKSKAVKKTGNDYKVIYDKERKSLYVIYTKDGKKVSEININNPNTGDALYDILYDDYGRITSIKDRNKQKLITIKNGQVESVKIYSGEFNYSNYVKYDKSHKNIITEQIYDNQEGLFYPKTKYEYDKDTNTLVCAYKYDPDGKNPMCYYFNPDGNLQTVMAR